MRLDDFDYHLPDEVIAQHPVEPRDSARLLVDQGSADPLHRHVRELGSFLREGDLLVVNDTRVIPARLRLRRHTGGAQGWPTSRPAPRSSAAAAGSSGWRMRAGRG